MRVTVSGVLPESFGLAFYLTNLSQIMLDPIQLEERITATLPEAIHGLFEHMHRAYGTPGAFFDSIGVDGAMRRELRGRLLEAA